MTVPRMVPPSRPHLSREAARAVILARGVTDAVALLGVRGYYRDTMGKPGQNDRGIYDDAVFVVSPTAFAAFNANTDPSADPSQQRVGLATLEPGVWRYKRGMHGYHSGNPYPALVQAEPVIVRRDGTEAAGPHPDWGEPLGGGRWRGLFAINIHRGGRTTTSSLGCQTLWPDQWDAFFALAKGEMIRHVVDRVPYVLVTQDALPA